MADGANNSAAMERLWAQHVHDYTELAHVSVDEDDGVTFTFEVWRCLCGVEAYVVTDLPSSTRAAS